MSTGAPPGSLHLISGIVLAILEEAAVRVLDEREKQRLRRRRRVGATLRPGKDTPLWNDLRKAVRFATGRRGDQAMLARILGQPRQRVNSYLTSGRQMPDAERTLLLLGWLTARREGRPMS